MSLPRPFSFPPNEDTGSSAPTDLLSSPGEPANLHHLSPKGLVRKIPVPDEPVAGTVVVMAPGVSGDASTAAELVVSHPRGRFSFEICDLRDNLIAVRGASTGVPLGRGQPYPATLRGMGMSVSVHVEVEQVVDGPNVRREERGFVFAVTQLRRDQQHELARFVGYFNASRGIEGGGGHAQSAPRAPVSRLARPAVIGGLLGVAVLAMVVAALVLGMALTRRPEVAVHVLRVARSGPQDQLHSLNAEVVPSQRATLRSSLPAAKIVTVVPKLGERVAAGSIVARADERAQHDAVQKAKARLLASEAAARQMRARAEAARTRDGGAVGNEEPLARAAEQALADAKAELQMREADVRRNEVAAPFDGVIVDLKVQTGDLVEPLAPICDLVDDRVLRVRASFSELDAAQLQPGMRATVRTYAGSVEGTVERLGDVVQPTGEGRSVNVDIALPPDARFRTGSSARVEIAGPRQEGVMLVPARSLAGTGSRRRAYVVDARGRVSGHEVTVAQSATPDMLIVEDGLPNESLLVADPLQPGVESGSTVRIVP